MSEAVVRTPGLQRSTGTRRPNVFAKLAARLKNRPDTEHETALNRLVLGAGAFALIYFIHLFGDARAGLLLSETADYFIIFILAGIIILAHIVWRPGVSVIRRAIGIPLDIINVCYLIHVGGETTAFLYPVLLWTIFGNGFRFGIAYLKAASLVGLVCFAAVVVTTEVWRAHPALSGGLLAGLVILPAYVSLLIRKLSEAKAQAEEASRSKSLFLASVSHELRTPLNAIIGFSDLLGDSRLDDEQADMTQTIGHSGRSLLALINSILDFSRFEVGKMPVTNENIDLFALLNDIRDMLTVQAQTKGVRLAVHIGCRVPRRVLASRRHLEEVLINLAGNAVKFTAHGHVLIAVDRLDESKGRATLRFEVADSGIGIAPEAQARIFESFTQADETIIDRFGGTGLGLAIAKQQVEAQGGQIGVESTLGVGSTFWFEIAFAVQPSAGESLVADVAVLALSADTGLTDLLEEQGVKASRFGALDEVVARLAEIPHGRTGGPVVFLDESCIGAVLESVASRLLGADAGPMPSLVLVQDAHTPAPARGVRALFSTALRRPLLATDVAAALRIACGSAGERNTARSTIAAVEQGRSLGVLVAEDNRTNQKVIAKILQRAGHQVTLADNGEAALKVLSQRNFDVVLMDVNMPVMNGIEATRRYRAAVNGGRHVPILALTADATAEAEARCAEAGMDGCITKPVEASRLVELISAFCPEGSAQETVATAPRFEFEAESDHPALPVDAPIDVDALAALDELGGRSFVQEIIAQFVGDSVAVLRGLDAAVTAGDIETFRDRAHALRSCAANVGAQAVYRLCLSWRELDAREFALHGREYMTELEAEFEQARAALDAYIK